MNNPELIFIAGPNAAGKSSFIRTRINDLDGCEIIMTDVYKGRSKEVFAQALAVKKDIILETVFNDSSFITLVDEARNAGYHTSLIVLFLDSIQHSIDRVAFRSIEQNGLSISGENIRINFNESFKNIAQYFFYFDRTDFIYTGITGMNKEIMGFNKSILRFYNSNELQYPQKFAQYSLGNNRLSQEAYSIISNNKDFQNIQQQNDLKEKLSERPRLRL
jgi:predicted ABC-type ATPase